MYVNSVVTQVENRSLMIILAMEKSKSIYLCRNSNDTIKTFINRLCLKMSQHKKKFENLQKSDISIKINEMPIPDNSMCGEIFQENISNITLHIKDNIFKVVINLPIIKELKLSTPPYKGLMVYPHSFNKAYNISVMNSTYSWYRIDSVQEFEVGNQITYIPTANDINYRLKLVCKPCNDKGQRGPTAEILSSKVEKNDVEVYPYENRLKEKQNNR